MGATMMTGIRALPVLTTASLFALAGNPEASASPRGLSIERAALELENPRFEIQGSFSGFTRATAFDLELFVVIWNKKTEERTISRAQFRASAEPNAFYIDAEGDVDLALGRFVVRGPMVAFEGRRSDFEIVVVLHDRGTGEWASNVAKGAELDEIHPRLTHPGKDGCGETSSPGGCPLRS